MRIAYVGAWLSENGDVLLRLYDRWDDFGYKTRFPKICRINGEEVERGAIKILFEHQPASHPFLANLREQGWDELFQ